jgi:hypothetical protein
MPISNPKISKTKRITKKERAKKYGPLASWVKKSITIVCPYKFVILKE